MVKKESYFLLEGGPGVLFAEVGGLNDQIRELREVYYYITFNKK